MPKLRHIHSEDQLPVTPPAFSIEEEGDSWWSGVCLNAVAIPVASALATLALSASLCFSYQQQTEDITSQPPVLEEEYWRVFVPEREPAKFLHLPDPEELPAGSLYGVPEEDPWLPSTIPSIQLPSLIQWTDDEFPQQAPPTIIDETEWLSWGTVLGAKVQVPQIADDDTVPQAPTPLSVDEDYWQPQKVTQLKSKVTLYLMGDEFAPPAQINEEEFWLVWVPQREPTRFLYLPDPEELPAGSLYGVPEEELWQVYTPPYLPARFIYIPDPEEIPAGSLHRVPEEDTWVPLVLKQGSNAARVFIADDELPVVQVPVFEDDSWQLWLVSWDRTWPHPVTAGDEIVPQPILPPDEDFWQVYTTTYPPLRFIYLPDPEEVPAGSLISVVIPDILRLTGVTYTFPGITGVTVSHTGTTGVVTLYTKIDNVDLESE